MKEYDVVILGGGSHGAGILQAAAAACHRALLIERLGLASGTSTASEPRCRVATDLPRGGALISRLNAQPARPPYQRFACDLTDADA